MTPGRILQDQKNGLANNWRVTRAEKAQGMTTKQRRNISTRERMQFFDSMMLNHCPPCISCAGTANINLSTNPLPINLNLHPSQIHIPRSTRLLHSRRQPILRLLVVKRPLRHHKQKSQRRAAEADVESFVDVLGSEADDDGEDAGCDEEEGGEEVGEGLAAEVLC